MFSLLTPLSVRGQDCGCAPADFDFDGDVDQEDFGHFQACMNGSGQEQDDPNCLDARLDADVDVDGDDLGIFTECLSGANVPYHPGVLVEPVITEFMASNDHTLEDEDGDYPDWIEIHHPAPCGPAIDLDGWYLTDDPMNPTKWRFPQTWLSLGEYLIVFASDKDRATPGQPLHTDFRLASIGGYLGLIMPDGTVVSEYVSDYPPQYTDISYGLAMENGTLTEPHIERFFIEPTPGAANSAGSADVGPVISDVTHTPDQPYDGDNLIVTARITEVVSPIDSVRMRYRVMFGGESELAMYDDGLHGDGAASDGVFGATIPAGAASPGQMVRYYLQAGDTQGHNSRWPLYEDPTDSAQYLGTMIADLAVSSDLPVLYWFVDDPSAAETELGTRSSVFHDGELYDNILTRRRGGSASYWPKKSFKLDFNKGHYFRYGDDVPRVEEFNLQSTHSDKSYIRQILAFETYRDGGVPYCDTFPMRVQQNGAFYSVAVFVEQVDKRYFERQKLDWDGALYKMYNQLYRTDEGVEKITRLDEGVEDLQALIDGHHHENPYRPEYLFDNINIPSCINYLAATTIMHDNDHVAKNYYLYRDTEGTGEWMFLPWDKDLTFGRNYVPGEPDPVLNDVIWSDDDSFGAGSPSHPLFGEYEHKKADGAWNGLIEALHDNATIREMYLRRLRTLMDTLLQPPGTPTNDLGFEGRIDALVGLMTPDVALDRSQWGNPYGAYQDFATAIHILKNDYLAVRRTHLFVTHAGLIPGVQPPTPTIQIGAIEYNPASANQDEEYIELINPNDFAVDVSGWQLSGGIDITFQPGTVVPSHSSMYVSPDVSAFRGRSSSPTGFEQRFVQGNYVGRLNARGETVILTDTDENVVDSVSYPGTPSDAQRYLRITEIMYHPQDPPPGSPYEDDDFEFIELRNIGPVTLDMTGVRFSVGIAFSFTTSDVTSLAPSAYVLAVRNRAAFESLYGTGLPVAGEYTGQLENSGEMVRLDDSWNEKILSFAYEDTWYPTTDGVGYSLVIIDDHADWMTWAEPASWQPSPAVGGSPGTP